MVDLSRDNDDIYRAVPPVQPASTTSTTSTASSWASLKQPPKPASSSTSSRNPLALLDNSITRAEVAASRSKESLIDQLDRQEREQQARERRDLLRKRMYGDVGDSMYGGTGNGLVDSEDYPSVSNKYARVGHGGAEGGNWLAARRAPVEEKEDTWQTQLRELKEAKARARELTESKKQESSSHSSYTAEVRKPSAGQNSSSTAPTERSANRRSNLLVQDEAEEENEAQKSVRRVTNWREFLTIPGVSNGRTGENGAKSGQTDQANISNLMQMYLAGQHNQSSAMRGQRLPTIAESMAEISIDPLIRKLLKCDLIEICADARGNGASGAKETQAFEEVPVRFLHEEHYIDSFQPLLLEEVKAALASQLNGERADDTRSSRGNSGGSYSDLPTAVPVRCVLRNARVGQAKLQEAQVVVSDPRRDKERDFRHDREQLRLTKDDLVLVLTSGSGGGKKHLHETKRKKLF